MAAPPPISNSIKSARSPLTPQQRDTVRRFATEWCQDLQSGDPGRVIVARENLLKPLSSLGGAGAVSDIFRQAYTDALLDPMKQIIRGDDAHAAVNAILVCQSLHTERAIDAMLNRLSMLEEPRLFVRLAAARACVRLFANTRFATSRAQDNALDTIVQVAERETSPLVVRHLLAALAAPNTPGARMRQAKTIGTLVDRINAEAGGPSPLMEPLREAIAALKVKYRTVPGPELQTLSPVIVPALGKLCAIGDRHWDAAQRDPRTQKIYGMAIADSEGLLRYINSATRRANGVLSTKLGEWWEKGDKPRYRDDLSTLQASLGG